MSRQVVIFGAGQVGSGLARALHARGDRVRVVRRSLRAVADGVEVRAADLTRVDEAVGAAAGADVVFFCTNPSAYTEAAWRAEFLPMGEAAIAAAQATGARLVVLDNLYAYGPTAERRTEATLMAAEGPKGRIRAAWARRLERAGAEGLRWTAGRAGDFFGPGAEDQSLMSTTQARRLAAGGGAMLLGRPTAPHAFSYVPDVVGGLIALADAADDVEGRAWHLPVHEVAPGELALRIARGAGRRGLTFVLPAWLVRALSPVVPLFRDLAETLYQWDRPFLVDDRAFRARFPGVGATLDAAVSDTARAAAAARLAGAPRR